MRLIGFDLETKGDGDGFGLQPYRVLQGRAEITSCAFVDEDGTNLFSQLWPNVGQLAVQLRSIAAQPDTYLIGWNVQFDCAWLIAIGLEEEVRACRWLDGEVLRRAIENDTTDKRYGLKPTVVKYLPEHAGYEAEVGGDFNEVNEALLTYNIADSARTAQLGRMFIDQLAGEKRLTLSALICKSIIPVARAWVEGIAIDEKAVDLWESKAIEDRDNSIAEFMRLARLKDSDAEEAKLMLASHTKLKKFLHAKGYPVAKTDKVELSKLYHVPMIQAIADWKKENKSLTTYIKAIRASLEYTGTDRTHPSCRLWNTYTGRFGYTSKTLKKFQTGIAIHQFPRKDEARNCIVAPKGKKLLELDFATQESRLICDWSLDPVMTDIFERDLDFHTYMAAIIAGIDYENMVDRVASGDEQAKQDRYLAKIVNLSCQYRTGWKKLIDVGRSQYDVIFDEPTAKYLHGLYRDTYKGIPKYWNDSIFLAKSQGYAETRGGRRVLIDDWSRSMLWQSESTAINFPIQGTGADMKFLAIAMIDDPLREVGGYYSLDLHDAMFAIVPDSSAGWDCALQMRDICSDLPYEAVFGWKPRVRLPVDLKYGDAWGSLKEIK